MNTNSYLVIELPSGKNPGGEYRCSNYEQMKSKLKQLRENGVPRKRLVAYQLAEVITLDTRD